MRRFADRAVIVTGAAKGIGRAIALDFARDGAHLFLADLDAQALDAVMDEAGAAAASVQRFVIDSSDEAAVGDMVARAEAVDGGVHALVCNAGIRGKLGSIVDYAEADFDDILRVNLRGPFVGMRHALPHMAARRSGSVVVISSNSALAGLASMPGYVATKNGVLGLVRAAALDMAPYGVRVNAVLPGATETPLLNSLYSLASPDDPAAAAARYAATVPIGRLIDPAEIAAMTLHLCSAGAGFITGGAFLVDGGRSIGTRTTTAGITEDRRESGAASARERSRSAI